eukprot:364756-Chlamydomonas_euryale.AAC.12
MAAPSRARIQVGRPPTVALRLVEKFEEAPVSLRQCTSGTCYAKYTSVLSKQRCGIGGRDRPEAGLK